MSRLPPWSVSGRGRYVIKVAAALVDAQNLHHVHTRRRERQRWAAHARDSVGAPPAVALVQPQKAAGAIEPVKVVLHVHPRVVSLGMNRAHGAGGSVGEHHVQRVLEAVEALQHQFAFPRPLHTREALLTRVAGYLHGTNLAAFGRNHAHAGRRVCLAGLGILDSGESRVEP